MKNSTSWCMEQAGQKQRKKKKKHKDPPPPLPPCPPPRGGGGGRHPQTACRWLAIDTGVRCWLCDPSAP